MQQLWGHWWNISVGSKPWLFPEWNLKVAPIHKKDKDRPKREANHSKMGGGRFNKQRNLHMRVVLGAQNKQISTHAHQDLKGVSHIHCVDCHNSTLLSQVCVLVLWARDTFQGQGRGEEPLITQLHSSANWWSHPPTISKSIVKAEEQRNLKKWVMRK